MNFLRYTWYKRSWCAILNFFQLSLQKHFALRMKSVLRAYRAHRREGNALISICPFGKKRNYSKQKGQNLAVWRLAGTWIAAQGMSRWCLTVFDLCSLFNERSTISACMGYLPSPAGAGASLREKTSQRPSLLLLLTTVRDSLWHCFTTTCDYQMFSIP